MRRGLRVALLLVAALPFAYLLAAMIGAVVPRNPGWRQPATGLMIFVRDNGVHTDLLVPAGADLARLVPPAHVANPAHARGWLALGWGQREFYLETPRWRDLTVRNAARAALGGGAVMHVEHGGPPRADAYTRGVVLDRAGYRRLVAFVRASFVVRGGRSIPLAGTGYATDDVFYEATGRYSAFRTSNQWTADALAAAGVRIGVWTPFSRSVMWRFRGGPGQTPG